MCAKHLVEEFYQKKTEVLPQGSISMPLGLFLEKLTGKKDNYVINMRVLRRLKMLYYANATVILQSMISMI